MPISFLIERHDIYTKAGYLLKMDDRKQDLCNHIWALSLFVHPGWCLLGKDCPETITNVFFFSADIILYIGLVQNTVLEKTK